MASEARWVIYAATAANVAIAVTKFIAATATNSGAMFSEGLHSVTDTGDDLLLLLGMYLSRKPASSKHPYGHGRQLYFWSMVVAMTIFGMGGGVSIYQGIHHLIDPERVDAGKWTFVVLAVAFVFEGISWAIATRGFRRARGRRSWWEGIERSKDPTTFTVVLEDSASLIGVSIAAIALVLVHVLHQAAWDAIASVAIGCLLIVVELVLGRETYSLLLGEAAEPELVGSIRAITRAQPGFTDVAEPRTVHLAPDLVHVDLDVVFDPDRTAGELQDATRQLEAALHERHPEILRVSLRFPRQKV